jgi:hypothetical protein
VAAGVGGPSSSHRARVHGWASRWGRVRSAMLRTIKRRSTPGRLYPLSPAVAVVRTRRNGALACRPRRARRGRGFGRPLIVRCELLRVDRWTLSRSGRNRSRVRLSVSRASRRPRCPARGSGGRVRELHDGARARRQPEGSSGAQRSRSVGFPSVRGRDRRQQLGGQPLGAREASRVLTCVPQTIPKEPLLPSRFTPSVRQLQPLTRRFRAWLAPRA